MGKNERIREVIGLEYMKRDWLIKDESSEHVQAAFVEIGKINRKLFAMIPYSVIFTDKDVYSSAKEMRKMVSESNIIYIYNGWSGHPILTEEQNNIGRAVHDVFAHMVCGCPFNFEGEYTAYLEQRKYYPQWTWDVLFAEIPAQTAAFYYNGNSHEFNQRAIAAPSRWMELGNMIELPDYSYNSVLNPNMFLQNKEVI